MRHRNAFCVSLEIDILSMYGTTCWVWTPKLRWGWLGTPTTLSPFRLIVSAHHARDHRITPSSFPVIMWWPFRVQHLSSSTLTRQEELAVSAMATRAAGLGLTISW